MPHPHYHFLCLVDCESGVKILSLKLERSCHRELNLEAGQTDGRTDKLTHRPENKIPINET